MAQSSPISYTVHVDAAGELTAAFTAHLPNLGKQLECDRIFLYVRSPSTRQGQVPFCWRRHPDIPLIYDETWQREPETLAEKDPLFAAALQGKPTVYVKDVETANADTLNREFERQNFGHRSLVHAHIFTENQLWGILQPCLFKRPHAWSLREQMLIERTVAEITPGLISYVRRAIYLTV